MEHTKLTELLNKVAQGEVSVEKAALELKTEPFEDLGFAKLDHHRKIRQGAAEVIYGAGKTPEQILKITEAFRKKGDNAVLITRMSQEAADLVGASLPNRYRRRTARKGWQWKGSHCYRWNQRFASGRRSSPNGRSSRE